MTKSEPYPKTKGSNKIQTMPVMNTHEKHVSQDFKSADYNPFGNDRLHCLENKILRRPDVFQSGSYMLALSLKRKFKIYLWAQHEQSLKVHQKNFCMSSTLKKSTES